MVTGPVMTPFTGRSVSPWVNVVQATVIGDRLQTSPRTMGGLAHLEP